MTPHPIPLAERDICSACSCWWHLPKWDQTKHEWCSEPLNGSCACHQPGFSEAPVIVEGEEVIGYLDPSGKGEGNWIGFTSFSEDDWEGGAA